MFVGHYNTYRFSFSDISSLVFAQCITKLTSGCIDYIKCIGYFTQCSGDAGRGQGSRLQPNPDVRCCRIRANLVIFIDDRETGEAYIGLPVKLSCILVLGR